MIVTVHVLPEDIQAGYRHCATLCPVARALKRSLPQVDRVVVDHSTVILDGRKYPVAGIFLPITRFDRTGEMEPFSFAIDMEVFDAPAH